MGQKDIAEKILLAYNDVFADIVNVLLFNGREVLKPSELEEQTPRSAYKADGKFHELERDVAKRWKRGNIRLACVGIENQTEPDADMPLRIIAYDGAEYRAQLAAGRQSEHYPVVTLVLYFGHKKHWDQPCSLRECIQIPEEFRPFVNDYKINLFEVAYLEPEQVAKFRSDFRIVADFFVQQRLTGDYTGSLDKIQHVHETLELLSIMAGDHRFEEAELSNEKGAPTNMSEVLDRIIDRGRLEGRKEGRLEGRKEGRLEGRKEGRLEGRLDILRGMLKNGISFELAMKSANIAQEEWGTYRELLMA